MTNRLSERQSNIELLRIISMIAIVAAHFFGHSGFDFQNERFSGSFNSFWLHLFLLGKPGVNAFVLISGYFLISQRTIRISKAVSLFLHMFFYSTFLYVLFMSSGSLHFTVKSLARHLAPISFSLWWFMSSYFMLYLLSPYVNITLRALTQRQYVGLLLLLFVFWGILPTLTLQPVQCNRLLWFVYLYSIGGYFKLYGTPKGAERRGVKLILFSTLIVLWALTAYCSTFMRWIFEIQYLPSLAMSVILFVLFLNLDIGNNKLINMIASATFGVYLIREHDYSRIFIWKYLFHGPSLADSGVLIPYSLLAVALVFSGCVVIELIRMRLLDRPFEIVSNKIGDLIRKVVNKSLSKFSNE